VTIPATIEWRNGAIRLVDQRALPQRLKFRTCRSVDDLCDAITTLTIRGAPALGAAGAYGVAVAAHTMRTKRQVEAAARKIASTRPTAVNLAWGVDLALDAFRRDGAAGALLEADRIATEDVARNQAIGSSGAPLIPEQANVLTHCHSGSLACVGYGTALGVIRAAAEQGRRPHVYVDETRPLLQGARLTMWELEQLDIPATVLPDSASASLMAHGKVDVAIVGADRIAANGDVANKIGTYAVALAAREHGVPFYVAAPTSTIDLDTQTGADIAIEERGATELGPQFEGRAYNPAFDITPARLITAIVTEVGVARPPYRRSLPSHVQRAKEAVTPHS
jgi:methylthioribose-1-phosphate isomerase